MVAQRRARPRWANNGTARGPADAAPAFSSLYVREADGSAADSEGRQLWRLTKPLDFSLTLNGSGIFIRVPAGFTTDFASVPRVLWPLLPPTGLYSRASVLHDYLCGHPGCSRFLADALFREAMYRLGVPWYRRVPMYYAVRAYGACKSLWRSCLSPWRSVVCRRSRPAVDADHTTVSS